jgi:YVTN family beta-propeller protein
LANRHHNERPLATIPITDGQPLIDIAFMPDGTRAYITCGNNNAIYVLDTATSRIVGQITSDYPGGLAIRSSNITVEISWLHS